jgi:hypothetical protein
MDQAVNLKAIKFRALAEKRVSQTMRNIERIGSLSSPKAYSYRSEQIEQMFKALRDKLDDAQARFTPASERQPALFRFE